MLTNVVSGGVERVGHRLGFSGAGAEMVAEVSNLPIHSAWGN